MLRIDIDQGRSSNDGAAKFPKTVHPQHKQGDPDNIERYAKRTPHAVIMSAEVAVPLELLVRMLNITVRIEMRWPARQPTPR